MDAASDSSDSESEENIVEVIEQEGGTESEDGEDIGDNNNSRRQSTCNKSGIIQGNWLTLKWFGD